MIQTHTVPPEWDDSRIDVFLGAVGSLSRSAVVKHIIADRVTIGGRVCTKKQRVRAGDVVVMDEPDPVLWDVAPEPLPLDILYQDDDLLVLNKPRGMVVHPAPGHHTGTLVSALLYHVRDLSGIGGVLRPGIVHRLDKDTSGLMVVAKNDNTHVALSAALKTHSVARIYTALCRGCPKQETFTVSAPLDRHPADRKRRAVVPNGKPAVTHFSVLARYEGYALLQCVLETGRTHQIRVHAKHVGHPLAGDTLYGGKSGELGLAGQALHAGELRFAHPRTGAAMVFNTPLPDWFADAVGRL